MPRVTVRMMGMAREAAGTSQKILEIRSDTDIKTVLHTLFKEHGAGLRDSVLDPLTQTPVSTLILLNRVEIGNLQGLQTPVSDGDNIILLSVTHGG